MEILIVVIIVMLLSGGAAIKKTKDNRIRNESVTMQLVIDNLPDCFTKSDNKEFKEKNAQAQLTKHYKQLFEGVTQSPSLSDGDYGDLEIGLKIGIELKTARSLKEPKERHRLSGQLDSYIAKYGSKKVLVVVAVEDIYMDKPMLENLRETVTSKGAFFELIDVV